MPTVLIADDSPTLRRIVTTVLERAGFTVLSVCDGVEAVQAALREQPDAVVLDVQMPRLSGYAASRLIKEDWRTADIPVILLTSLEAQSNRYWGNQTGADRYLTKSFEPAELIAAVRELLPAAPRAHARSVLVDDDEVLTRVCDLLERKLFEASLVTAVTSVAREAHGRPEIIRGILAVISEVVSYDAAALVLVAERMAFVATPTALGRGCLELVVARAVAAARPGDRSTAVGYTRYPVEVASRSATPEPAEAVSTSIAIPLRGRRQRVIGALALASARATTLGESTLATLRVIESPVSLLLEASALPEGAGIRDVAAG